MVTQLRIPDAPGGIRFCTVCDTFLPVSKFPLGPRRYSCKMHMWLTTGKKAKAKRMSDTSKRITFRLWGKAYDDSKRFNRAWKTQDNVDGQPRNHAYISITQREIEQLLDTATDYASMSVCDHPMEFAKRFAVVPVDPKEVLSLYNAALVPSTVKRQLFRSWKLDGLDGYTKLFHEAKISTKSVFQPSQEQLEMMQSTMNSILLSGCARIHSVPKHVCEEFEVREDGNDCPRISEF
jgi:hypothetical protein